MLNRRSQARKVYRNPSHKMVAIIMIVIFGGSIVLTITEANHPGVAKLGLVGILIIITSAVRLAWAGIASYEQEVQVANFFRSFSLKWADIDRFELGRYWLLPEVCLIYTTTGERKCASAVHEGGFPPNGSGREAIKELNRELAQEREKHGGTASRVSHIDGVVSTS